MTVNDIYKELEANPPLKEFMQEVINRNLTPQQLEELTARLQEPAKEK